MEAVVLPGFVHACGGKFVDFQIRVAIRDVIQRRSAGWVGLQDVCWILLSTDQ